MAYIEGKAIQKMKNEIENIAVTVILEGVGTAFFFSSRRRATVTVDCNAALTTKKKNEVKDLQAEVGGFRENNIPLVSGRSCVRSEVNKGHEKPQFRSLTFEIKQRFTEEIELHLVCSNTGKSIAVSVNNKSDYCPVGGF